MTSNAGNEVAGSFSDVVVVGRIGRRVDSRLLPSGDEVTVFTVVVDRPPRDRGGVAVDAIACQTFRAPVVRRLATLSEGDWIRVEGSLRRRFWRTGTGLGSVMEVDAHRVVRVRVQP